MLKEKQHHIIEQIINKPKNELHYEVNFKTGMVSLFWSSTQNTNSEIQDYCLSLPFRHFRKDKNLVKFKVGVISNDLTICNPYLEFSKEEIISTFSNEYKKNNKILLIIIESI